MEIKRAIFLAATFLLLFSVSASAVTIGPALTKKERNRLNSENAARDSGKISEDQLMAAFLKEDYAKVEKFTQPLTKRGHSHLEFDEMLYLRALSLMKLGRMEEARLQLTQLESEGATEGLRARAAYSLGDSYYFASGNLTAYRNALSRYPLFDEADMVRTRIREKQAAPFVAPAVKMPAGDIVPPPETLHVNDGWVVSVAPSLAGSSKARNGSTRRTVSDCG